MLSGYCARAATEAYVARFGASLPAEHYSEFLNLHLRLSSLGIGTFPGAAEDAVDEACAQVVERALVSGINVVDTAAHYRYGRSPAAVGEGLRRALAHGVERDQVFLIAKGGFLAFPGGPPEDFGAWFDREIAAAGRGAPGDLSGMNLLSPDYLMHQLDACGRAMGVETLDAFLVDQPEVHIPSIGKERLNRKLLAVFVALERAVAEGRIRCYGISTFNGFRVETDDPLFQSITSMQGLAERAATEVHGTGARHQFRLIEMPFNQAMPEAFTRFNQATGQGNVASTIQAAHQLRVYAVASHTLGKGLLAGQCSDAVRAALPQLANDAQRTMQFNRSTPGVGTSLVGISNPEHLDDLLAVARTAPMARGEYLRLYQRAD